MRRLFLAVLVAALAFALNPSARANETVSGVQIMHTVRVPGSIWGSWDVMVWFDIVRAEQPGGTIYLEVYLMEEDVFWDDKIGPDIVCIPPGAWTEDDNGGWSTHVTAFFHGVPDYLGTDWYIDGHCVCEISCEEAYARLGVAYDVNSDGDGEYAFVVENDPNGAAMDPDITATQVVLGDLSFDLAPTVDSGELVEFVHLDDRAPLPDDGSVQDGTVPYQIVFSNGDTTQGLALGPDTGDWTYLGQGKASAAHGLPVLTGTGELEQNAVITLSLTHAAPNTLAFFVAGFGQADMPFKGGTLVPDLSGPSFTLPLVTDDAGEITFSFVYIRAKSFFDIYFQYWIKDADGVFTASNGLKASNAP